MVNVGIHHTWILWDMPCTYVHLRFREAECVSIQPFKLKFAAIPGLKNLALQWGFTSLQFLQLVVKQYNLSEILLV